MRFGDDFKQFIGSAKSETAFVREATRLVEAAGFSPGRRRPTKADVAPGSRWYAVNRGRSIVAFVVGTDPVATGDAHRQLAQRLGAPRAEAEAVPRFVRDLDARYDGARGAEELPVGQPSAGADWPRHEDGRHVRGRSTSATIRRTRC